MSLFNKLVNVREDVYTLVEKGVSGTVSQIQGDWFATPSIVQLVDRPCI